MSQTPTATPDQPTVKPWGESSPASSLSFTCWWPEPDPAQRWFAVAAGGVGLLAALLIPGAPRAGINLAICGLAAAVPVGMLAYRRGHKLGRRRRIGRVSIALGAVALGLAAVSAIRASEWLAWGCAAAALCLGASAALGVRRFPAVLATVPLFGVAVLRALPWAGKGVRLADARGLPRGWLRGIGVGVVCAVVVAGLLASADAAYADLIAALWPSTELELLPARGLIFVATVATVLGAMFAASNQLTQRAASTHPPRYPAEWLTPLVLVTVTIAAFLALEATMLFGGDDIVTRVGTVSYAGRAREGFGQLTVVTLIVLGLLAWAGRAAAAGPAGHRRLMGFGGGTLLVLALLLGASALRRLWLYQDAYGWTVTRLNAGAFEIWVGIVLAGVAAGWLLRRTDLLPRFLVGSAGLGLLVIAMAGPDAMVAAANVARYEQSQEIDALYLSTLSADAVPALSRLPEPWRSCVLVGRTVDDDPWFGWNLSRSRAAARLRSQPPSEPQANCWTGQERILGGR